MLNWEPETALTQTKLRVHVKVRYVGSSVCVIPRSDVMGVLHDATSTAGITLCRMFEDICQGKSPQNFGRSRNGRALFHKRSPLISVSLK